MTNSDDQTSTESRILNSTWVEALRVHRRVWKSTTAMLGISVATAGLAMLAVVAMLAPLIRSQVKGLDNSTSGLLLITTELSAPLVLLAGLATLVWAVGVITVAHGAFAGKPVRVSTGVATGVRRLGSSFVATLIAAAAMALTAAAYPILLISGIAGLVATPLVRRHNRGRETTRRWPAIKTLLVLLIPFGPAAVMAAWWCLYLAEVARPGVSSRAALDASRARVRGRELQTIMQIGAAIAFVVACQFVLGAMLAWIGSDGAAASIGLLAGQLLVVAFPVIVVAALAHDGDFSVGAPVAGAPVGPRTRFGRHTTITANLLLASLGIQFVVLPLIMAAGATSASASNLTVEITRVSPAIGTEVLAGEVTFIYNISESPDFGGPAPSGELRLYIGESLVDAVIEIPADPADTAWRGSWEFTTTLTAGTDIMLYTVYDGDTRHDFTDAQTFITVLDLVGTSTSVISTPSPSLFGTSVDLEATVDAATTPVGDVTFSSSVAGYLGTASVVGGIATLSTTALAYPSETVTASFAEQNSFAASEGKTVHRVDLVTTAVAVITDPASPTKVGDTVEARIDVTALAGVSVPEGTVQLSDVVDGSSTELAAGLPLVDGKATFDLSALDAGDHDLVVSYYPTARSGWDSAGPSIWPHTVEKSASTTTLSVSPDASTTGQAVTLTAAVGSADGPTAVGKVEFFADGLLLDSVDVDTSGEAVSTTTALPVGARTLTAAFLGDRALDASESGTVAHTVSESDVEVTVSATPSTVELGETTLVTVTVSPSAPGGGIPSGNVKLTDGATQLGGPFALNALGVGTATVPMDVRGDRTIVATYLGDGSYSSGMGSTAVIVNGLTTSTTLQRGSVNPSVFGRDVIFDVQVTAVGAAVPTGTVTLVSRAGDLATVNVDAAGRAQFTISSLPVAVSSLSSRYNGDGQHATSVSKPEIEHRVVKAPTKTNVATSPSPAIATDLTTITATIDGGALTAPTGAVEFRSLAGVFYGSAPLVDGAATITARLAGRVGTIRVSYNGDSNFEPNTGSEVQSVTVVRKTPGVVLATSAPVAEYGEVTTLSATVQATAGFAAIGTVNFFDGERNLGSGLLNGSGVAEISFCVAFAPCPPGLPALSVGSHVLTATYTGDDNYGVSTGSLTVSVGTARTALALTASSNAGPLGRLVTLSADVTSVSSPAQPTGTVEFSAVVGEAMGTASRSRVLLSVEQLDAFGRAWVSVRVGSEIPVDTVALEARFFPTRGVSSFLGSSDDVAFKVETIPVTFDDRSVFATVGTPLSVSADVSVPAPAPDLDPTGAVVVTNNEGSSCTTAVNSACELTWTSAGAGSVTFDYAGDTWYAPAGGAVSVVVAKGVPTVTALAITDRGLQADWVAGEPITVSYSFLGASTGRVRVFSGPLEHCVDLGLVGTCTVMLPSGQFSDFAPIFVSLSGDDNWESAGIELVKPLRECYPARFVAFPASAGTVTANPSPNCADDTGYLEGTVVNLFARPNGELKFAGWDDGTSTSIRQFTVVNSASDVALFNRPCELLTLTTDGVGELTVDPLPDCNDPRFAVFGGPDDGSFVASPFGDKSVSGYYRSTTEVTITANPIDIPGRAANEVYNVTGAGLWKGYYQFNVEVDRERVVAAEFGTVCTHLDLDEETSVSRSTNCSTYEGDGWVAGTPLVVEAALDSNEVVTGWYVDDLPTPEQEPGAASSYAFDADGDDHKIWFLTGTCGAVTFEIERNGWPGSIDIPEPPEGPCSELGPTYYPDWTQLSLTFNEHVPEYVPPFSVGYFPYVYAEDIYVANWAAGTYVANWAEGGSSSNYGSYFVNGDEAVTLEFANRRWCHDAPVFFGEAGDEFSWEQKTNGCRGEEVDGRYPVEVTGTTSADASLFGWAIWAGGVWEEHASIMRGADRVVTTKAPGLFGGFRATATHCQAVDITGIIRLDNGVPVPLDRPTAAAFMTAESASGITCPGYPRAVYKLGSEVMLTVLSPDAFPVVDWSGGVTAAGGNHAVTLDGAVPRLQVRGVVQVTCFDLLLARGGVTDFDDPTCLGSPEGTSRYLAGSTIDLTASVLEDEVWLGWSDVSVSPFTTLTGYRPLRFTIDRDSRLHPVYRDKTFEEDFEDFAVDVVEVLETVGDELAVLGKKTLGVLAVVGAAIITDLPPISMVFMALEGVATVLDFVFGDVGGPDFRNVMTNVIATVNLVSASAKCVGEWGLSSSSESGPDAPPPAPPAPLVNEDFAVMAARSLLGAPDVSFIEIELPDGTRTSDPEIIAALEAEIAEELLSGLEAGEEGSDWLTISHNLSTAYSSDEVQGTKTVLKVLKKLDKYEVKLPSGMRLRSVKAPVYKTIKKEAKTALTNSIKGKYYSLTGKTFSSTTTGTVADTIPVSSGAFKNRLGKAAPGAVISLGSLLFEMGSAGTFGWDDSAADAFGPAPELDQCLSDAAPPWMEDAFGGIPAP
tara:strand:- start:349 stop:7668 length:7320 start_codon:yes stop_codon:yes gene_type:complete